MIYIKTVIVPCYCSDDRLNTPSCKNSKQHNNPTIAAKNSLEVLFRASDNIPHHYPKFYVTEDFGILNIVLED